MHDIATKPSTATKSYYSASASDDLLPPINLSDNLSWTPTRENPAGDETLENWHLPTPETTLSSIRRPASTGLQKFPFTPPMHSRTDSSSKPEVGVANGHRWRFNGNGQLVDSEAAAADWDLADDMTGLRIGEGSNDTVDEVRGQIRTPPKSKIIAAAVAQLTEASPLETSSNTSANSSPHASDHQISISHSRGSSTDSTISSSHESATGNTLLGSALAPVKLDSPGEPKERPHSFSGGLSSADLRRLQLAGEGASEISDRQIPQQQWVSNPYASSNDKQLPTEQLSYPSLANQSAHIHRPQPQQPQQLPQHYDYRSGPLPTAPGSGRDELQIDYNLQQRNFNPLPQAPGVGPGLPPPNFVAGRPGNAMQGMPYRQLPRGFPQQGLVPSPTALGYPAHTSHLSLGSTQQLYDMMLPGPPQESHHPAVARVQQQHNVFRATHHHSASDPSAIRDASTMSLLNNMPTFTPGIYPPSMAPPPPPQAMTMYPNQYYTQDAYARPDVAQAMAARLQSQYTGQYGILPQGVGMDGGLSSPSSAGGQNGPSANNRKLGLYKTELCRSWEEKGTCRYGSKCQFAHGEDELRKVARHPKYKTEICRTFWVSGSCPYGKRCCFIHTELPTSGTANAPGVGPAGDNVMPPSHPDGRPRSLSTNSDPPESVSLLARISKRNHDPSSTNASTPIDLTPPNGFQFNSRPPTGSLRVDTSALDGANLKQNKSAYPSFASNGILMPTPEHISAKSPAPVTAGPDLGRHNTSRLEIVGYNHPRPNKTVSSNSSVRHSFNGSEVDLNFAPSPPSVAGHSSFTMASADGSSNASHTPRVNGHVRAGSAGNWGSLTRSSHLVPSYPLSSTPGDVAIHSPWSATELAVGSSRLNEKTWA